MEDVNIFTFNLTASEMKAITDFGSDPCVDNTKCTGAKGNACYEVGCSKCSSVKPSKSCGSCGCAVCCPGCVLASSKGLSYCAPGKATLGKGGDHHHYHHPHSTPDFMKLHV